MRENYERADMEANQLRIPANNVVRLSYIVLAVRCFNFSVLQYLVFDVPSVGACMWVGVWECECEGECGCV